MKNAQLLFKENVNLYKNCKLKNFVSQKRFNSKLVFHSAYHNKRIRA